MKFLPDDGHVHQYTDGRCEWCGAPPADNPLIALAEGAKEAGVEVTETSFGEDDPRILADNPAGTIRLDEFRAVSPEIAAALGIEEAGAGGTALVTHANFMVAVLTDETIKGLATEAQRVLAWAKTIEISDGTTAKHAADTLRSIALMRRNAATRTKELLAPMTDALKQMKDDLATIAAPLTEADQIARLKITEWDALQRRIKADAEDAVRLAAESAKAAARVTDAGGEAPDLSAIEPVEVPADRGPIRPDSGGTVSMVDHWSAEIEDEDAIPREWMQPNLSKINLEARQRKGGKAIPGIKWVNNPTPSVR